MANDLNLAINIKANTEGKGEINALVQELEQLAKGGGDAAPAFEKLAGKLRELSSQQALIQQFAELKRVTVESSAAMQAATQATAASANALREKQAALAAAKAAEEQASAALNAAKAAVTANAAAAKQAATEINALKTAIAASGSATTEQKAALDEAKARLTGYKDATKSARDSVAALTPAQRAAATAAKQAAAEHAAAARSFDQTRQAAGNAKAAYQQNAASLQEMRNQMRGAGIESNNLAAAQVAVNRALEQSTQQAQRMGTATNKGSSALSGMAGMARGLVAPLTAALSAQKFIEVSVQLENMERGFRAITGSAQAAAAEMAYVRSVADKFGLSAMDASKSYMSLMASTKGTAVEGQKTREVFEAVSYAMSAAGKTTAETERAFMALSQMASKGVISMEELRGQLGESLPGALKAAADGFGITTQQLIKLVESGKMTAQDLFPALKKGLDEMYGANNAAAQSTDTLTQKWNHLTNALTGGVKSMKDGFAGAFFSGLMDAATAGVIALSQAYDALFKVTSLGYAELKAIWNSDDFTINTNRIADGIAKINAEMVDGLIKSSKSSETLAWVLNFIGAEQIKTAETTAQLTDATTKAADATAKATVANKDNSIAITQLGVAYTEQNDKLATSIKLSEKQIERAKEGVDASNATAKALGNERDMLESAAHGAQIMANVTAALSEQRKKQAILAKEEYEATKKLAEEEGTATTTRKEAIEKLKEKADALAVVAQKTNEQAQASQIAATQADVEAQSWQDNSKRLVELKDAYDKATESVATLRAEKAKGADVSAKLAQAETALAHAAGMYKDALNDQKAAITTNLQLKQAEASVATAGIRLAIEEQRTIYEVAKAKGDERTAAQALMEIKRLEIELARLNAQVKRAEAQAALLLVDANREELRAKGQLTKAKEAELRATQLAAQAKLKEADISDVVARRMQELLDVTQAAGDAARFSAGDYDTLAGALGRAGDAAEKLSRTQSNIKPMSVDMEQVAYKLGYSIDEVKAASGLINDYVAQEMALGKQGDVANKAGIERAIRDAKAKGLTAGEATFDDYLKKSVVTTANGPMSGAEGMMGHWKSIYSNAGNEAKSASERQTAIALAEKKISDLANSAGNPAARAEAERALLNAAEVSGQRSGFGSTSVVRIELGGKATNIAVASESDRAALTNLMIELERYSKVAA